MDPFSLNPTESLDTYPLLPLLSYHLGRAKETSPAHKVHWGHQREWQIANSERIKGTSHTQDYYSRSHPSLHQLRADYEWFRLCRLLHDVIKKVFPRSPGSLTCLPHEIPEECPGQRRFHLQVLHLATMSCLSFKWNAKQRHRKKRNTLVGLQVYIISPKHNSSAS